MDDLNKKGNVEAPTEDMVVEVKEEAPKVIETPAPAEIFTVVEEQPGYPGGEEARISYLQQNIKYPEEAKEFSAFLRKRKETRLAREKRAVEKKTNTKV